MSYKAENALTQAVLDIADEEGITDRLAAENHSDGTTSLKIAVNDYNEVYLFGQIFAPADPEVRVSHDHCTLTIFLINTSVTPHDDSTGPAPRFPIPELLQVPESKPEISKEENEALIADRDHPLSKARMILSSCAARIEQDCENTKLKPRTTHFKWEVEAVLKIISIFGIPKPEIMKDAP